MPTLRTDEAVKAAPRTLRELERAVRPCTSCALHVDRTTAVVGLGPQDARLMIISDVPRRHEDLQGRPVAGATRNVLDNALLGVGLDPSEVRLTSIVRCRPADDRPPSRDEVAACSAHLRAELDLVNPEVVVSLGEAATSMLLGRPVPLERVAGYRLDVRRGVTLVPTHHPADAVRGVPQAARALGRDLAVAKAVLDGRMKTGAEALADLRARVGANGSMAGCNGSSVGANASPVGANRSRVAR